MTRSDREKAKASAVVAAHQQKLAAASAAALADNARVSAAMDAASYDAKGGHGWAAIPVDAPDPFDDAPDGPAKPGAYLGEN